MVQSLVGDFPSTTDAEAVPVPVATRFGLPGISATIFASRACVSVRPHAASNSGRRLAQFPGHDPEAADLDVPDDGAPIGEAAHGVVSHLPHLTQETTSLQGAPSLE
jgi:hypothetical protein